MWSDRSPSSKGSANKERCSEVRVYSQESYRFLLELALAKGYRFVGFGPREVAERCVYLRHDVDYSLGIALELARINASMGVQGTFCLLLRSQIYNLLSHQSLDCAQEIRSLGQRLALHYQLPRTIPPSDDALTTLIHADFDILHHHLPDAEPAFAWHNPTPEVFQRGLHFYPPDLLNIYSARFIKDIPYFSDSNMRHTVAEFEGVIRSGDHSDLHLLFHPLNWVCGGSSVREIFSRTWPYVIREREQDFMANRTYQELLPEGMPEPILQSFAEQWHQATGDESHDG